MTLSEVDLLKFGVNQGTFPAQLYKYRDLSDRTYEIIENSAMWFSKASNFNDPFDCNLSETHDHNLDDFKEYLATLKLAANQHAAMINLFHTNPVSVREICINARNKAINEKGILSLSKVNSNILMWSHYAREHTGIVLGFDMLKDPEFFLPPWVVTYSDTYEELNYFRNRPATVRRNISTKALLWAYEEEIRIVKPQSRAWDFKRECLSEIFFGCKTPTAEIEKFMLHCRSNGFNHIQFYKAEIRHGAFSLDFTHLA
jgi:hypothetical protein